MALNPKALLKMKERLGIFRQEHPKIQPFFHQLREEGLPAGSVLELKVTLPDGSERVANIRLTENDLETLQMLSSHKKKE